MDDKPKYDLCRACPAPIIWATQNPTEANPHPKPNPLNVTPAANGNLLLNKETMTYDVLTGAELETADAADQELYLSHFVTCPKRQRFRKKKGGGK